MGEVMAVSPGHTVVQVTAGTQRAAIPVEVHAGVRPLLIPPCGTEWWAEQTAGNASTSACDSNIDLAFFENNTNVLPTESFSGRAGVLPAFESRLPNNLLASLFHSISIPAGKILIVAQVQAPRGERIDLPGARQARYE